jgi:hypothetical protein
LAIAAAVPTMPTSPIPLAPKRVDVRVSLVEPVHFDGTDVGVGGDVIADEVVVDDMPERWALRCNLCDAGGASWNDRRVNVGKLTSRLCHPNGTSAHGFLQAGATGKSLDRRTEWRRNT